MVIMKLPFINNNNIKGIAKLPLDKIDRKGEE